MKLQLRLKSSMSVESDEQTDVFTVLRRGEPVFDAMFCWYDYKNPDVFSASLRSLTELQPSGLPGIGDGFMLLHWVYETLLVNQRDHEFFHEIFGSDDGSEVLLDLYQGD